MFQIKRRANDVTAADVVIQQSLCMSKRNSKNYAGFNNLLRNKIITLTELLAILRATAVMCIAMGQ